MIRVDPYFSSLFVLQNQTNKQTNKQNQKTKQNKQKQKTTTTTKQKRENIFSQKYTNLMQNQSRNPNI